MRCEELVALGMSPEAALAEARRQFGDIGEARAAMLALDRGKIAETRRREWWAGMVHDARHAGAGTRRELTNAFARRSDEQHNVEPAVART
jgi:hypothetical protein